jgi:hypothetical protein
LAFDTHHPPSLFRRTGPISQGILDRVSLRTTFFCSGWFSRLSQSFMSSVTHSQRAFGGEVHEMRCHAACRYSVPYVMHLGICLSKKWRASW